MTAIVLSINNFSEDSNFEPEPLRWALMSSFIMDEQSKSDETRSNSLTDYSVNTNGELGTQENRIFTANWGEEAN